MLSKIFKNLKTTFCITMIIASVSACGSKSAKSGGGGNSQGGGGIPTEGMGTQSVTLSGQLAVGPGLHGLASSPDTVVAVPVINGTFSTDSLSLIQETKIGDNGSFSLSLSKNNNWVGLLVDSKLPKKDQVVGFLALSDSYNSLESLPVPKAAGNIELGAVTQNASGDGIAEKTISQASTLFNLSTQALTELAQTDDVLRNAKNLYINWDKAKGTSYAVTQIHGFRANPSTLLNQYSLPTDFTWQGYAMNADTNATLVGINDYCSGAAIFGLRAPAGKKFATKWEQNLSETTSQGKTLTTTNQNGEVLCTDNQYMGMSGRGNNLRFNFGADLSIQNILDGYWELLSSGSPVASLDLKISSPVDDQGHPISYIPAVNMTVVNNTVTRLDIKWYVWDKKSSQYTEVTNLDTLKNSISNYTLALSQYQPTRVDENISQISSSVTTFQKQWKYFGSPTGTDPVLNDLAFFFRLGGVDYVFEWEL